VIAGVRVALHAHAQLAHFLNPAPDLLAGDADFLGDFRAADDDGRIFGEQREQRVDAPVGDARQIRHSFGGHRGLGRILERGRGYKPTGGGRGELPSLKGFRCVGDEVQKAAHVEAGAVRQAEAHYDQTF
jgi:hypothetical protein